MVFTDFASSFLESAGWNIESALNNFLGGIDMSNAGTSNTGFRTAEEVLTGGIEGVPERAPIAQFTDTLLELDPAQVPRSLAAAAAPRPTAICAIVAARSIGNCIRPPA